MCNLQGCGGARVSGGGTSGTCAMPGRYARGGGAGPGPGKAMSFQGGVGGRGLRGHRRRLYQTHPSRGGEQPQVPCRPLPLRRAQVHGQTHQQRVWEEEEVCVNPSSTGGPGDLLRLV